MYKRKATHMKRSQYMQNISLPPTKLQYKIVIPIELT